MTRWLVCIGLLEESDPVRIEWEGPNCNGSLFVCNWNFYSDNDRGGTHHMGFHFEKQQPARVCSDRFSSRPNGDKRKTSRVMILINL
ncbi:hypothetical protein CEXT_463661 [Caerostris extrusa]|uniref:Uncharacterized protein n=1 Tax=Caerostris extrusa TaxID=172846 RepID=A0AAV4WXK1_CAEEX|nr:hypothetical protein CEXT_463661 [Caerostris extrusa]